MTMMELKNYIDLCPNTSPWITVMPNGCEEDNDMDGIVNSNDAFPNDPSQWFDSDSDCYGDNINGNNPDHFPNDSTQWNDTDGMDTVTTIQHIFLKTAFGKTGKETKVVFLAKSTIYETADRFSE